LFIFGHLVLNIYMANKNNLTDIWNIYSDTIIKEGKTTRPIKGGNKKMGTKPGKGAVELNSKEAQDIQNTGNEGNTDPNYDIEGLEEPIDPKKTKGKKNLYTPEKYSSEKFDEKVEKDYRESININMKSVFDKLFEEVMDGQESNEELDALGIDTGEDDAGEESGDITITLDKDMAKALCDILQAAMGDEEADDAEAEDYEMEEVSYDEAEEDDEEDELEEATELTAVPDSAGQSLQSKKNTVGSVKSTTGKADGKVKGQKGDEEGSSKGHKLMSKDNKVSTKNKTGHSLFA
tara:strand:- start:3026 stop:3901 length:876 start_codon:yes stop_codon:yes gene_type:complete